MSRLATQADYARLGLVVSATPNEVKAAFRLLAKRYHPDTNQGDTTAARRFREVRDSYEAICNGDSPALTSQVQRPGKGPLNMRRPHAPPPKHEPLSLQTMRRTDRYWIGHTDVVVGPDRTCYLRTTAVIRTQATASAQVLVEYDGGYSVHLPDSKSHRWTMTTDPSGLAVAELWVGKTRCQNAELPTSLLSNTVADMAFGTSAWVVANTLVVDDLGCWIDPHETVAVSRTLTTPVRIERRLNGYHVVADGSPALWRSQRRHPSSHHVLATKATLGGRVVQAKSRVAS